MNYKFEGEKNVVWGRREPLTGYGKFLKVQNLEAYNDILMWSPKISLKPCVNFRFLAEFLPANTKFESGATEIIILTLPYIKQSWPIKVMVSPFSNAAQSP